MKGKAKPNFIKILRIGIAASLLLVLVVVSVYFITLSRKQARYPSKPKELTQQKVEKKEQIVHFEVKGERGNFLIRANKYYVGEDNNYHLKGQVEIIDFGKEESENVFIYGEEVVHDKDLNHFVLTGQSVVKYKDLIIKSDLLEYDKKKEVFNSNKDVSFSSGRLSGSAKKSVYSMRQESLKLREKIHLQLIPKSENSLPLFVEGKKLDYNRKKKAGEVVGKVNLTQGKNQASAHILNFILTSDEENVKNLSLRGQVKSFLVEEEKQDFSEAQDAPFPSTGRREIEADEINLDRFYDLLRVSSIKAKGNCFFRSFAPSGSSIQVQGESLHFLFNRKGRLKEFNAFKQVRLIDHNKNSGEKRIIEGEEVSIRGKANVLRIKGSDEVGAKLSSQDSEILAEEITIYLKNDNLEVVDGVKVILMAKGEKGSIGFFFKEQPIFITSQEMRYYKDKKRFLFKKDVKVWQQKVMLLAEEFSFFEDKGRILCSGGVKSIYSYKLKEEKEEQRIEISAEKMNINPKKNLISYDENGSFKVKDIDLRAQSISVHLKKENGEMQAIVAQGNVEIVQGTIEVRGEKARYDLVKDVITLTGNPFVLDKNRGMTRGDKLTFFLADGRIVVENKERERSVTVIKS